MSIWAILLRLLFPSWRFFEKTGTLFSVTILYTNTEGKSAVCVPLFEPHFSSRNWHSFFFSSERLTHLFAFAAAERLMTKNSALTDLSKSPLQITSELCQDPDYCFLKQQTLSQAILRVPRPHRAQFQIQGRSPRTSEACEFLAVSPELEIE